MTSDVETKVYSNASLEPRAEVQSSMKPRAQLDSETSSNAAVYSYTDSEHEEVPNKGPVLKVDSRTKSKAESRYTQLSNKSNETDRQFPVEENRMLISEDGSSTSIRDGYDMRSNDAGKKRIQLSMKSRAQLDSETSSNAAVYSYTDSEHEEVLNKGPVSKVDSRTKSKAESRYIQLSNESSWMDRHFPLRRKYNSQFWELI